MRKEHHKDMFENSDFTETPDFFWGHSRRRLFGIFHHATKGFKNSYKSPVIVCCAPIFEEKLHSHRVLVNFARYAAIQGFHVLRFDYFGDGDSDGLFEEASLSSRIEDICSAVRVAKEKFQTSKVFLLGLRIGASLAIYCGEAISKEFCGIVAWAPIFDLKGYIMGLLRANLSWQMVIHKKIIHNRDELAKKIMAGETVNVEGYEIGKTLFEQSLEINLCEKIDALNVPTLIVAISPLGEKSKQFQMLRSRNKNKEIKTIGIQEKEFWKPQKIVYPACADLFSTTTKWIKRLC